MMRLSPERRPVIAAIAAQVVCVLAGTALLAQTPAGQPEWQQGATMQRQFSGPEPDRTKIPLTAGQFLRFEIRHPGSNLSVRFRDPSGKPILEVITRGAGYNPETVMTIADLTGEYDLQIADTGGNPQGYSLLVSQLRAATPADRETVAAHDGYWAGYRILASRTASSGRGATVPARLACETFRKYNDYFLAGLACNDLGTAVRLAGSVRDSVPWFAAASAAFHAAGVPKSEAVAVNNQANALDALGEALEALKLYEHALEASRAAGERTVAALALSNTAAAEDRLARWQAALEHYREALALSREAGARQREGNVLLNMAVVYQKLGETGEALRLLGEALPLLRTVGDKALEATTLAALANVHLTLQEPSKSLDFLAAALSLYRSIGDRGGEGESLRLEGRALSALGRPAEAKASFLRALELARGLGNRRNTGQSLLFLAAELLKTGEPALAASNGEEALVEFRGIGERRLEAIALELIARAESARGNVGDARLRMEEALTVSEIARQGADSQQLRASFFATRQDGYSFYIDLLMRTGGLEALALESSERSRARSLLEMLAASGTAIREGVDAKLLGRERDISNLLNAKGARLLVASATSPQAGDLKKEIRDLESEYQDVQAAIRKSSPRYAAVTQPSVLTALQIQANLLDKDTLLLEYSLGEERSYLWVVSHQGLRSYSLPARAKIEAQALQVAQLIAARAPARALDAASKELSRMVFGEAGPALGGKRLLIVPDGALQSVPFSMLPEPGTNAPMVVRHEVVMTPSASALAALRAQVSGRKPAPKSLAVFADPVFDSSDARAGGAASAVAAQPETARLLEHLSLAPATTGSASPGGGALRIARLPFTAKEAERILSVAPEATDLKAIGFDASRATAIGGRLSEYKYLHFATHGYLDTEHPELSALVLSQIDRQHRPEDGFLRVDDIYNARLSADLVVLSACQTGLGKEVRGEGLMGLTRAFFYSGVPRVVVSLWNVNDQATSELMAGFYEKLLRHGKRPSEALREAQLELRKQKRWAAPYYWAAFVQQGDWQ